MKEHIFDSFLDKEMTEEYFLENFYTFKEQAIRHLNNILLAKAIFSIGKDYVKCEPSVEMLAKIDYDSLPENLIDYISVEKNPWAKFGMRSDCLRLFLKLNDDTIKFKKK